jgi:hypothetical protein
MIFASFAANVQICDQGYIIDKPRYRSRGPARGHCPTSLRNRLGLLGNLLRSMFDGPIFSHQVLWNSGEIRRSNGFSQIDLVPRDALPHCSAERVERHSILGVIGDRICALVVKSMISDPHSDPQKAQSYRSTFGHPPSEGRQRSRPYTLGPLSYGAWPQMRQRRNLASFQPERVQDLRHAPVQRSVWSEHHETALDRSHHRRSIRDLRCEARISGHTTMRGSCPSGYCTIAVGPSDSPFGPHQGPSHSGVVLERGGRTTTWVVLGVPAGL